MRQARGERLLRHTRDSMFLNAEPEHGVIASSGKQALACGARSSRLDLEVQRFIQECLRQPACQPACAVKLVNCRYDSRIGHVHNNEWRILGHAARPCLSASDGVSILRSVPAAIASMFLGQALCRDPANCGLHRKSRDFHRRTAIDLTARFAGTGSSMTVSSAPISIGARNAICMTCLRATGKSSMSSRVSDAAGPNDVWQSRSNRRLGSPSWISGRFREAIRSSALAWSRPGHETRIRN